MSSALRIALVAAAAALFVVRGPLRALHDSADFAILYNASRAWLQGGDAYDPATLERVRAEAGAPAPPDAASTHTQYPPATFAVLSPFAAMPWRAASLAWLLATIALVVIAGTLLVRASPPGAWRRATLAAFVLAFAPLHTGIAKGNTSIAAAMLVLIAAAAAERGRSTTSGLLLGIAAALKPQLGVPFFLAELLGRRWRSLSLAVLVSASLLAVGAGRAQSASPQWIAELRRNYLVFAGPGGLNDASAANPYRYHLVNLQLPLSSLPLSRTAVDAIAWTIAGVLLAAFVALHRGRKREAFLDAAAIGAIILLPLYRRFYDAALLLAAAPWAWRAANARQRVAVVALLPFLVPGAALLHTIFGEKSSLFWNVVVIPHAAWCELAVAICVVSAYRRC